MASSVETVILAQIAAAAGKSIDPMNVAKEVQPERWQRILPLVKSEAVILAKQGLVTILRHNKPADPSDFRGVYRLRAPLPGDAQQAADAIDEI